MSTDKVDAEMPSPATGTITEILADDACGYNEWFEVYNASGSDIVLGGSGNDRINGDKGNDLLAGEAGDDYRA